MLITHLMLREVNQVQTRILAAVSEACGQLGISFFLVHGSLLGAVRNRGFIPDDDDIFFRRKRIKLNRIPPSKRMNIIPQKDIAHGRIEPRIRSGNDISLFSKENGERPHAGTAHTKEMKTAWLGK